MLAAAMGMMNESGFKTYQG